MQAKDRIIVALDVDSLDKAKALVELLSPYVGCFKVGLELLAAAGAPQVVAAVAAGADYLVIGRPILSPPTEIGSPVNAARAIAEEIAEAL